MNPRICAIVILVLMSPALLPQQHDVEGHVDINWKIDLHERDNVGYSIYDPYRDAVYSIYSKELRILDAQTGKVNKVYTFVDEGTNKTEFVSQLYTFESSTYVVLRDYWDNAELARIENGEVLWKFNPKQGYYTYISTFLWLYYADNVLERNGRVYFMVWSKDTYVACLDAEDGTLIWDRTVEDFSGQRMELYNANLYIGGLNWSVPSTVVLDAETGALVRHVKGFMMAEIYGGRMVGFGGGAVRRWELVSYRNFTCMDLYGNVLWKRNLGEEYGPWYYFLQIRNGTIYSTTKGTLYVMDMDGNILWKFTDPFADASLWPYVLCLQPPIFDAEGRMYLGYFYLDELGWPCSIFFDEAIRMGRYPYIYCLNQKGDVLWKATPVFNESQMFFIGFIETIDREENLYVRGWYYVPNEDPHHWEKYPVRGHYLASIRVSVPPPDIRPYMFTAYAFIASSAVTLAAVFAHFQRRK
jgi:outer membrane protein assembly factor BamB